MALASSLPSMSGPRENLGPCAIPTTCDFMLEYCPRAFSPQKTFYSYDWWRFGDQSQQFGDLLSVLHLPRTCGLSTRMGPASSPTSGPMSRSQGDVSGFV